VITFSFDETRLHMAVTLNAVRY